MPILPRETDIFPDDLFELDLSITDSESRWWAMYTISRREKELMRQLCRHEIPFYCPIVPRKNRSPSGRTRISYVPLFAGYVFVLADAPGREQALKSNCISRCLEVHDATALTRDLKQIQHLIQCDVPLLPESRLEAGARVRVRSGPMAGTEGTVIRRRGRERLLVAVEFLQQGASVLLDDFLVERVD